MNQPEFSDEDLLTSAQFLANFWLLVTMAYLKQHNQSISDWVRYGGDYVVRGFKNRQPLQAHELAYIIALRSVSLGGFLVYLAGNAQSATVTVKFSAEEMVTAFGLSLDEFDLYIGGAYKPLATSVGLKHRSRRNGGIWTWYISS